jgi:hypothetical protein
MCACVAKKAVRALGEKAVRALGEKAVRALGEKAVRALWVGVPRGAPSRALTRVTPTSTRNS